MPADTAQRPRRHADTRPARAASQATFARRRLDKALAEIMAQGWTQVILIGPDGKTRTYP